MELYAIIFSIKNIYIKNYCFIYLYSDSKYIIDTINNNYRIKKNLDLWQELKLLILNIGKIKFYWIKGHNKDYYNEECNKLAQIRDNCVIFKDSYYENIKNIS